MAYARILHRYDDGQSTELEVGLAVNGPDALDECVRRVSVLWHVCMTEDTEAEGE